MERQKTEAMTEIQNRLFALRDEKNAAFGAKLIPNIPSETILGVRMPQMRKLARELYRAGKAESWKDGTVLAAELMLARAVGSYTPMREFSLKVGP